MTDDMMAYRRRFLNAICWEEKVRRFVSYASRALKAVLTCPRFASLFLPPFWLYRFMWNNRLGKVSEEQQQRNSGRVCLCVCVWWCGRGGNMAKAWKTCTAVRLFVMCSRALQQRWGFGKPSPHRQADRSRGIPDIFWLFVFHREASRCSRLLLQSAGSLFELHITPEHAQTMSEPTKNPPQKVH